MKAPEPKQVKPDYVLINGMHFSHSEILRWREEQMARLDRHADDVAVDNFAQAMKNKMAIMREKGAGGWDNHSVCRTDYLAKCLVHSTMKGDPVDIANFAMMLFNRTDSDVEITLAMTDLLLTNRQRSAPSKPASHCECHNDEWGEYIICKPCYEKDNPHIVADKPAPKLEQVAPMPMARDCGCYMDEWSKFVTCFECYQKRND